MKNRTASKPRRCKDTTYQFIWQQQRLYKWENVFIATDKLMEELQWRRAEAMQQLEEVLARAVFGDEKK